MSSVLLKFPLALTHLSHVFVFRLCSVFRLCYTWLMYPVCSQGKIKKLDEGEDVLYSDSEEERAHQDMKVCLSFQFDIVSKLFTQLLIYTSCMNTLIPASLTNSFQLSGATPRPSTAAEARRSAHLQGRPEEEEAALHHKPQGQNPLRERSPLRQGPQPVRQALHRHGARLQQVPGVPSGVHVPAASGQHGDANGGDRQRARSRGVPQRDRGAKRGLQRRRQGHAGVVVGHDRHPRPHAGQPQHTWLQLGAQEGAAASAVAPYESFPRVGPEANQEKSKRISGQPQRTPTN